MPFMWCLCPRVDCGVQCSITGYIMCNLSTVGEGMSLNLFCSCGDRDVVTFICLVVLLCCVALLYNDMGVVH